MNKFISKIDNCVIDYQIVNGNLSYKTEGTDWQDFILEDKRAYSTEEYAEFLSLFSHYDLVNYPKLFAAKLTTMEANSND